MAEKFQDSLNITTVVAPIHRAADEKVAVKLMSRLQQVTMEAESGVYREEVLRGSLENR